jgi:hypothetical protein
MATPLVTIFARDLAENLYPSNEFYKNSRDDSPFIDGSKVNLPQAGTAPTGVTNPTDFPLTTEKRVDTAEEYNLDLFATYPTHLRIDEDLIVNYDKRAAILKDHSAVLNTMIADNFCDQWFPPAAAATYNHIRTTGSASAALAPGATGSRKAITLADIIAVATRMDAFDVPSENRYALIPSEMYADLLNIADFVSYEKRGMTDLIGKGLIGEVLGFKFFKRSRAGVYTNATPAVYKAHTAATATTDELACLFWQENAVRRAEGPTEVFINEKQAQYLGSLMNCAVRSGGRIARTDYKGVIALIQITT